MLVSGLSGTSATPLLALFTENGELQQTFAGGVGRIPPGIAVQKDDRIVSVTGTDLARYWP